LGVMRYAYALHGSVRDQRDRLYMSPAAFKDAMVYQHTQHATSYYAL